MNRYNKDYELSRQKEIEFEGVLNYYGLKTENTSALNEFPDYDISATGKTGDISTYELKYNSAYSTGNVVIELKKFINEKSVASGLSATKATYYTFCFESDGNFYVMKTDVLRDMVEKKQYINLVNKNNYLLAIFTKESIISKCSIL